MAKAKNITKKASGAKKASAAKTGATARTASAGKKATTAKKKPSVQKSNRKGATIDCRVSNDRRNTPDRRKKQGPVAVERRSIERRAKVNRRRQIDPTTCERDYTAEEIEFMNALEEYKRANGRMFPTCSEVLEVIRELGYQKCSAADLTESADRPGAVPVPELPAGQVPEQAAV